MAEVEATQSGEPIAWSKTLRQKIVGVTKKKKPQDRIALIKKLCPDLAVPWTYKNVGQERKAKEAMIQLWQLLLKEAMGATYLDRPYYFRCMWLVCRRHEFEILNLNWSGGMKPAAPSADIKLGVAYRELLVASIEFIIVNLSKSGAFSSIIEFSSNILAINYLHFHKMANMILDTIWPSEKEKASQKEEPDLAQNIKSIIASREKQAEGVDPTNRSVQVFSKIPAYYTALETLQYAKPFKPSKGRQHWLKRFEENSNYLYRLVLDIISHAVYMCEGVPAEDIAWHIMPGYHKILHAYFYHLKTKLDVPQWHKKKTVFECSQVMLYNPDLLDLLIKTLFSKTNLYDIQAVEAALELMDEWFKVVKRVRRFPTFPKRFDYKHFCAGISILLDSDHHAILGKTIGFLYANIDMFLAKQRRYLIQEILLNKFFFRLFLHWSSDVRLLYIQLVVNRLVRLEKQRGPLAAYAKMETENQIDKEVKEQILLRIDILKKAVNWDANASEFKDRFESEKKERFINAILLGGGKKKLNGSGSALAALTSQPTPKFGPPSLVKENNNNSYSNNSSSAEILVQEQESLTPPAESSLEEVVIEDKIAAESEASTQSVDKPANGHNAQNGTSTQLDNAGASSSTSEETDKAKKKKKKKKDKEKEGAESGESATSKKRKKKKKPTIELSSSSSALSTGTPSPSSPTASSSASPLVSPSTTASEEKGLKGSRRQLANGTPADRKDEKQVEQCPVVPEVEEPFDPLAIPPGLEVYGMAALYKYEMLVEDLAKFVHDPATQAMYPDLHYQGPITIDA